jgi:hypothetical protein
MVVVAFQKDAYLGVRDYIIRESVVAEEGKWEIVEVRCADSGVRMFRLPPTRYLRSSWVDFLKELTELCKR